MIVTTLIGTLVGGVTSVLPGVLEYFNAKERNKHEQNMLELKSKQMALAAQHKIDVINTTADANEGESLRSHDSKLDGGSFINALRASVRPVITYSFFGLFVFIKIMAVMVFMESVSPNDTLTNALVWKEIFGIIWDENTAGIFAAIMGFWFGGRAIEKLRKR